MLFGILLEFRIILPCRGLHLRNTSTSGPLEADGAWQMWASVQPWGDAAVAWPVTHELGGHLCTGRDFVHWTTHRNVLVNPFLPETSTPCWSSLNGRREVTLFRDFPD